MQPNPYKINPLWKKDGKISADRPTSDFIKPSQYGHLPEFCDNFDSNQHV